VIEGAVMRKSEMTEDQLRQRSLFVETLAAAGWRGTNFNRNFDQGLSSSPEASMTYANPRVSLRLDMAFADPRVILYVDAKSGKSLGLVFKCTARFESLLRVMTDMQDRIGPDNVKDEREHLLAVCPEMFQISREGDKLIPIKSKKATK
jgi:hypothetical protein